MMLFVDTDRNKSGGWNGHDFIVNRVIRGEVIIGRKYCNPLGIAKSIRDKICRKGKKLEIEIHGAILGLKADIIDIEFKWNDNMQEYGNIIDFYENGDTETGWRFHFVYFTLSRTHL